MAIFCPSFTCALKSLIIVVSILYPNFTCSNVTFPFKFLVSIFSLCVSISSASSRNSKILSAAAIIACNIDDICAI